MRERQTEKIKACKRNRLLVLETCFRIGNGQFLSELDLETYFFKDWIWRSELTIHQSQLSLCQALLRAYIYLCL